MAEDRRTGPATRLTVIERDSRDHAKTISEMIAAHTSLAGRVTMLEQANSERMVLEARQEERAIARIAWQEKVENELASIRGAGNKLLWIIATAIVGAFMAFILNGGLAQ